MIGGDLIADDSIADRSITQSEVITNSCANERFLGSKLCLTPGQAAQRNLNSETIVWFQPLARCDALLGLDMGHRGDELQF